MAAIKISPEVEALTVAAAEAVAGQISVSTKRRFAVSLNHLAVSLRVLRTRTGPVAKSSVRDFLVQTIHPSLSLFNSTLSTYELNNEICLQTIVFLGLLYGAPRIEGLSEYSAAGLRNVLDAIPHCFFVLASQGRREDVRSLLNALFLVAGGTAGQRRETNALTRLLTFPKPGWYQARSEEDHFIKALRAMFAGWLSAKESLQSWTPVTYLDIAEAVSISLSTRLEKVGRREEVRILIPGILGVSRFIISGENGDPICLLALAFASGVLKGSEGYELAGDTRLHAEVSGVMIRIFSDKESSLQRFSGRQSLESFKLVDSGTLSTAFLVFRVAGSLSRLLSVEQVLVCRCAVEALVESSASMDIVDTYVPSLFLRQLQWCVNSYSMMLGYAYAAFVNKGGSNEECIGFLQFLVSRHSSKGAVGRFALAAALKCECTPRIAAAFLDILSILRNRTSAVFDASAPRLIPVISNDSAAIRSVAGLVITLLDTPITPTDQVRSLFLLKGISLIVSRVSDKRHVNDRSVGNAPCNGGHSELWLRFVDVVQSALFLSLKNEVFAGGCIESLKQVIHSENVDLLPARKNLTVCLPALLLKKYLFEGNPGTQRRRLVHVVGILDAIARTTVDEAIANSCIQKIIKCAEHVGEEDDRLIGILLLRFMGRCNLEILEAAMDGIRTFIGKREGRKRRFLPLVRVAVLGTDLVRKNACVLWLLAFFGNITGSAKPELLETGKTINAKL